MEVGVVIGVISMLGVLTVYFWVVRRSQREVIQNQQ
jgi:hypothetical protein